MSPTVLRFLDTAADALMNAAVGDVAERGATLFREVITAGPPERELKPSLIPVLDSLHSLAPSPLLAALRVAGALLPWVPSHRVDDGGQSTGLVLLDECFDFGELSVGLSVVGPNSAYPEHRHPPVEVYLVLGGTAQWRFGGSEDYVPVAPGHTLSNNSNDLHGIRTGDEPVVALWVLFD